MSVLRLALLSVRNVFRNRGERRNNVHIAASLHVQREEFAPISSFLASTIGSTRFCCRFCTLEPLHWLRQPVDALRLSSDGISGRDRGQVKTEVRYNAASYSSPPLRCD